MKAGEQVQAGRVERVGLVSTNSIRGGANRRALQTAARNCPIFEAWSDEPWVVDGRAVRVSLVCFSRSDDESVPERWLDGQSVEEIYADLTARCGDTSSDLTKAQRLSRNLGAAFMGDTKGGPFDISGGAGTSMASGARKPQWHAQFGCAEAVDKWHGHHKAFGRQMDRRFRLDDGAGGSGVLPAPFQHVRSMFIRYGCATAGNPTASTGGGTSSRGRVCGGRSTPVALHRHATVAKHRLFVWLDTRTCPDHQLIVIARDDDTTFGILHSRFHEAWSLRLGTSLGNTPRYTPTTTFENLPVSRRVIA